MKIRISVFILTFIMLLTVLAGCADGAQSGKQSEEGSTAGSGSSSALISENETDVPDDYILGGHSNGADRYGNGKADQR